MRRYYIVPPTESNDVSPWRGKLVLMKSEPAESSYEGMISPR